MKAGNTILALFLLIMFAVASCATISPPVVEEEEEITEEMKVLPRFNPEWDLE